MTRDEIIQGLEKEIRRIHREPKWKMLGIFITVDEAEDIVSLLKEQEAAKPNGTRKAISFAFNGMLTGYCPRCGTIVNSVGNPGACGKCGQKFDWGSD